MPGRILVVDDVATNRIVMKVRLSDAYYDVLQADSGTTALEMVHREKPALVLLDMVMQDKSGLEVCRELKANPDTAHIPVIMITAARQPRQKLRALQAGADDFLTKPLDEMMLLSRVRCLLRARAAEQELALREGTQRALGFHEPEQFFVPAGRIALIANKREEALGWKSALKGKVSGELHVMTRAQALASTEKDVPDIFVIASDLDRRGGGLTMLTDLRSRQATRHAGVVMVVDENARETAAMALDLGANDLVTAPFETEEMALRLMTQMQRKAQADRLRTSLQDGLQMAVTDPLTGLFNRRYAMPHLSAMAEQAQAKNAPFCVLQLDVDRFKQVNDRYGHPAGDAVLEQLARQLRSETRAVDMVARTGGEEFLIAMPDTGEDEAAEIAERLRHRIAETPILLPGGKGALAVSVSIGMAMWHSRSCTVDDLMERSDSALYAAKADGRNKVAAA
ncbi:diguanylate cyclase [Actibacterium mucosum]|uniref:diguanylate cyclase n=1 Tax=Actibacterium mucosum TaxID=1087332 RepID=UPI0005535987|nr:diguanylate cyclase [Actibacterium mucosum]